MIDTAGIRIAQGNSIACERVEGVNDNMSKSHYHDFFEIYYLESGQRYVMLENEIHLIHSGQFLLYSPYTMHHSYGEKDVPFKRLVLYFRPIEIQSHTLQSALLNKIGVYTDTTTGQYSIHNLLKLFLQEEATMQPYKDERMNALLQLLLITIERQLASPVSIEKQTRIGQVVDYIHTHYQENITINSLSEIFYLSPYYLCREFKKYTNRTIIQYLHVTRILNAQRKIMETNKSITTISSETGFTNLTHFNRIFKSCTGMTPTNYRKQYRMH